MKSLLYLDTNVILARYAPQEPKHRSAKTLLHRIQHGEMAAVTSTLTLIEVASTTSRAYHRYTEGQWQRKEVAGAFLRKVANIPHLEFIPIGGPVAIKLEGQRVKLPALFAVALEVSSKIGAKTLDNLHLAAASIATRIYDREIHYFVTLDQDILKRRKEIKRQIKTEVATPTQIIEADLPEQ